MTEARDIDEIVETLEVLADWSALDGCKREVLALIADWRAKKVAPLAIAAIENKDWGPDWEEIEEARTIANQALG